MYVHACVITFPDMPPARVVAPNRPECPASLRPWRPRESQRREPGHDQQKLENLIVDGAGEPAQEGIDQTMAAETRIDMLKSTPHNCNSLPRAYMEIRRKMVITATKGVIRARLSSSAS